jgi:hypothetical protein
LTRKESSLGLSLATRSKEKISRKGARGKKGGESSFSNLWRGSTTPPSFAG